jgi:hypothetical protein
MSTEIPLHPHTVGIKPKETLPLTWARANSSRFLQRWLARLDDTDDRQNQNWRADMHFRRQSALHSGRMVLGEWDHLDDLEFRDHLAATDDAEWRTLWSRALHEEPEKPVSRSTDYRRRKIVGKVGPVGRPKRNVSSEDPL